MRHQSGSLPSLPSETSGFISPFHTLTEMSVKQHFPSPPAPLTPGPMDTPGAHPCPCATLQVPSCLQNIPSSVRSCRDSLGGVIKSTLESRLFAQTHLPPPAAPGVRSSPRDSCVLFRLTKHLHLFYSITPWGLTAAASPVALLHPGTCPRSVQASAKLPLASINPWLNRGSKACDTWGMKDVNITLLQNLHFKETWFSTISKNPALLVVVEFRRLFSWFQETLSTGGKLLKSEYKPGGQRGARVPKAPQSSGWRMLQARRPFSPSGLPVQ